GVLLEANCADRQGCTLAGSRDGKVNGSGGQAVRGVARNHNSAVGLNRDGPGDVIVVTIALEVGGAQSTGAKGLVERTVGIVSRQGQISRRRTVTRISGGDNLPIGLYFDAGGAIEISKEISGLLSTVAETVIEAAILVVAGEREIVGRDIVAVPGHARQNNLAVRLNRKACGVIETSKEVGRLLSAGAKGVVQAAIRLIAGHREIVRAGGRIKGQACQDEVAIGLKSNAVSHILAAEEIRGNLSTGAKALVEASVGVVAGEPEIRGRGVIAVVCISGQDDLSVRLNDKAKGGVL